MKKTVYLGMLLGFALILGYVESLVPFVFTIPGMKMGLPNLAILLTLSLFGEKEAFAVNTARVILSGFLFGNLFFDFLLRLSLKAQYILCMRLWFHLWPRFLIRWKSFAKP